MARGHRGGAASELVELVHQHHVLFPLVVEELLELCVALLQGLDLLSLTFAGRLGGATIPEDALDSALLLLVFCLRTLPGWGLDAASDVVMLVSIILPGREVGLGLGQDLTPRLALLGRLLVTRLGRRRLIVRVWGVVLGVVDRLRSHDGLRGVGGVVVGRRLEEWVVVTAGSGHEGLGGRVLELDLGRRGRRGGRLVLPRFHFGWMCVVLEDLSCLQRGLLGVEAVRAVTRLL